MNYETHQKGDESEDSTYDGVMRTSKESESRAASARLSTHFSERSAKPLVADLRERGDPDEWRTVMRQSLCAIGHGYVSVRFTILRCLMQVGGSSGG
jgi:hypothetical protein